MDLLIYVLSWRTICYNNSMNWEYLIIGIVFLIALIYLYNRVIAPFAKKSGGCNKGCGCGPSIEDLEKKRK